MIQMEYQTVDIVKGQHEPSGGSRTVSGDHRKSGFEQYEEERMEERLAGRGNPAKKHDVRGKWQRLVKTNQAIHRAFPHPTVGSRSVSANKVAATSVWKRDELIDFEAPTQRPQEPPHGGTRQPLDSEPGSPIATPANLVAGSLQPHAHLMDNDAYDARFSGLQPGHGDMLERDGGVREMETLSPGPGNWHSRSNLVQSTNSGRSEEGQSASEADTASIRSNLKDEEKGSPATRAYHRAFNKIMSKRNKSAVHDVTRTTMMDKPLLAEFEQERLEHKARKKVQREVKRVAEEAKRDAEREQRELRELANPIPESAMGGYKESDLLSKATKGMYKLFNKPGIHHKEHKEPVGTVDARQAKLVMPRANIFDCVGPSQAAIAVAHMRMGPRPSPNKDLQFATVESTQRDVPAWTMEEYMTKNARQSDWNEREDDADFGGIEGNNLLNNYFADDLDSDWDSDSD